MKYGRSHSYFAFFRSGFFTINVDNLLEICFMILWEVKLKVPSSIGFDTMQPLIKFEGIYLP